MKSLKSTINRIDISPSILAADFSNLREVIIDTERSGVGFLHFDVMDNHFVPNLTFGYKFIRDLREYTRLIFDVHLMITEPIKWIDRFYKSGSDIITIHYESDTRDNIIRTLEMIRGFGIYAGISIKPKTSPEVLDDLKGLFDMVLIMTVEPGFAGQKMIADALDKIPHVRNIVGDDVVIAVDGGIKADNFTEVVKRGADLMVMGSGFYGYKDKRALIDMIKGSV